MRATKVQASLRIRAVSPEPSLLAHTSSQSRGTFRQKARSLASLNGWACAVEICHDGMLEDTNWFDGLKCLVCMVSIQVVLQTAKSLAVFQMILIFPFLDSDVRRSTSYGVYNLFGLLECLVTWQISMPVIKV